MSAVQYFRYPFTGHHVLLMQRGISGSVGYWRPSSLVWEMSFTHLVEPFPLEGDDDLDEDGNDTGEINIAHDLWSRNTDINSADTRNSSQFLTHHVVIYLCYLIIRRQLVTSGAWINLKSMRESKDSSNIESHTENIICC